jgi:hypothetical protein
MSDSKPYPTLAHAFAALDSLPIAGAAQITADRPGVDYDALVRVRHLLPHVWSDEAVLERIGMTPQGGVTFLWRRPGAQLELTVDPFALYACRVDTKSTTRDWVRPTLEQVVADVRAALGLPALGASSNSGAAPAPVARA